MVERLVMVYLHADVYLQYGYEFYHMFINCMSDSCNYCGKDQATDSVWYAYIADVNAENPPWMIKFLSLHAILDNFCDNLSDCLPTES